MITAASETSLSIPWRSFLSNRKTKRLIKRRMALCKIGWIACAMQRVQWWMQLKQLHPRFQKHQSQPLHLLQSPCSIQKLDQMPLKHLSHRDLPRTDLQFSQNQSQHLRLLCLHPYAPQLPLHLHPLSPAVHDHPSRLHNKTESVHWTPSMQVSIAQSAVSLLKARWCLLWIKYGMLIALLALLVDSLWRTSNFLKRMDSPIARRIIKICLVCIVIIVMNP